MANIVLVIETEPSVTLGPKTILKDALYTWYTTNQVTIENKMANRKIIMPNARDIEFITGTMTTTFLNATSIDRELITSEFYTEKGVMILDWFVSYGNVYIKLRMD